MGILELVQLLVALFGRIMGRTVSVTVDSKALQAKNGACGTGGLQARI